MNQGRDIACGFEDELVTLTIDQIIYLKVVPKSARGGAKFKQILSSIREVGIIEPPVVTRDKSHNGKYMLLDGHLRLECLKDIGENEVTCLLSNDDESFTYNKHVNRLSPVQEHKMVLRAIEQGVSEDKIAKALNINIRGIRRRVNLLDGICPEAADMLKDKMVSSGAFPILRKMKAFRQVEAATLMCDANIFTTSYANALLAATPKEQLVREDKPKKIKGLTEEQIARMESEMASLQREYRIIEDEYGSNVLNLTLAKGYIGSLLGNAQVIRYLAQNHSQILDQFQQIADLKSLNRAEGAAEVS